MKKIRAALTRDLDPLFFAMTCLLLASVLFSAKIMADEVLLAQDNGLDFFAVRSPIYWFAAK